MSFVNTIIIISHVPILAAVISAALLYSKFGRALKVFSWFIFLSGIIQFTSLAFCYSRQNNMPLLHLYVPAGFACLVWFYKTVLGDLISIRIMWGVIILFLLFTVLNTFLVQHIFEFNSNALVVESICIIILALFTFIFFLNDTVKETGVQDIKSLTWINSGLFIYYLSCVLIFYFGGTLLSRFSKDLGRLTWIFHSFFSIVMYTCFIIGLWKRSKTQCL